MAKKHFKYIVLVILVILGHPWLFAQERIPMTLEKSGIYTIPCEVNGLKLSFVFDTGASAVHISLLEAAFMLKNGYITENDFIGTGNYIMADGSIAENALINLKSIKIGNTIIRNVTACVSSSINASLLLGQSAIQKLGTYAVDGNYLILYNSNGSSHNNSTLDCQYQLWLTLSDEYDTGSFEEFRDYLSNPSNRWRLYNDIYSDYDLPDYETFNSQLGFEYLNEDLSLERKIALAKERLSNLYRVLKEDDYNLGTETEYKNKLRDPSTATRFYNNMTEDGYQLGSLTDFLVLVSLAYNSSHLVQTNSNHESNPQVNLRNLYSTLLIEGYAPPVFEQFLDDMKDEDNLRRVHSTLLKEGYTPPDFEQFKIDMGFNKGHGVDLSHLNSNDTYNLSYYIAQVSAQVNLREGPGTNYKIISKIPKGSYVLLSSSDKGQSFRKVLYIDKNIYGYVSNKYLTNFNKLEEDASEILQPVARNYKNTADITIKNNSNKNATINIGSNSYKFKPHETRTITNVKPGKYKIMASSPGVIPYVVIDNVEAGYEYSWEFYITTIRY